MDIGIMAPSDPSSDSRARYDYEGTGNGPSTSLRVLAEVVDDVRFDDYTRQLYATDASAYQQTSIAVAFPQSTAEGSDLHESACITVEQTVVSSPPDLGLS